MMIAKPLKSLVAGILCLAAVTGFSGAWVTLLWDNNTETNISHYNIWQSTTGAYAVISSPQTNSVLVSNLSTQWQYNWFVTAVDSNALGSLPSGIVTYRPPAQPTLVMTVNSIAIATNTGIDELEGPWTNIATQVTSFLLSWNTSDGKLQYCTNLAAPVWTTINVTNTPTTGVVWQVSSAPQAFFRLVK